MIYIKHGILKIVPTAENDEWQDTGYFKAYQLSAIKYNNGSIPACIWPIPVSNPTISTIQVIPISILNGVKTQGTPISIDISFSTKDSTNGVFYINTNELYDLQTQNQLYQYKITMSDASVYKSKQLWEYEGTKVILAPIITLSTSNLTFGDVVVGDTSAEQTYTVSGTNLIGNITITAPSGYEISLTTSTGFTNSLVLAEASGSVPNTTIYARFKPVAETSYNDDITHTSITATQKDIACTGEGIIVITVTSDQSVSFVTPSFTHTFASGAIYINFNVGAGWELMTTGVAKTYDFTSDGAAEYPITFKGNLSNSTAFKGSSSKLKGAADLSLLTGLLDLQLFSNADLTGLTMPTLAAPLTNLQIYSTGITGVLDLSTTPISTKLEAYSCPNLTNITFSTTGNGLMTWFRIPISDITGVLDLSNLAISGLFHVFINPNLTGITFKTTGNSTVSSFFAYLCTSLTALNLVNVPVSTDFYAYSCTVLASIAFKTSGNSKITTWKVYSNPLLTTIDLSNVPIGGSFEGYSNTILTSYTFSTTGNSVVTLFKVNSCNITGVLSLANVPISTLFWVGVNALLTGITFKTTGNSTVSSFNAASNPLLTSLDLSNVPIGGIFSITNNTTQNSLTFAASGNSLLTQFLAYLCILPNIDFSVFPTSDNVDIQLHTNVMSVTEVNNQLINLDTTNWINGTLTLQQTPDSIPTGAGETSRAQLVTDGWAVTVDV